MKLFKQISFALIFTALILNCSDSGSDSGPKDPGYSCPYSEQIGTDNSLNSFTYTPVSGSPDLIVMTKNLYLGADLSAILTETNPFVIMDLSGDILDVIIASEFTRRTEGIAREIKQLDPDIIALQEAVIISTGEPDFRDDKEINADCVEIDFLAVLEQALLDQGLDYKEAVTSVNADLEITDLTKDIRITDSDVILVRSGFTVGSTYSKVYDTNFQVQITGFPAINVERSYSEALVNTGAAAGTVRVINTHLEVPVGTDITVQSAQADELIAYINNVVIPKNDHPTILLGDINSGPNAGSYSTFQQVYDNIMLITGIFDTWDFLGLGDGYTCCYDEDLSTGTLYTRIDNIFYLNNGTTTLSAAGAVVTESDTDEKIIKTDDSLIWASDHGSVAVGFHAAL